MNKFVVTDQLQEILGTRVKLPTTVMWNRLEGRPVRKNFSRALKAEVRDPLWMIARQAQLGEFKGDDGASPVIAKVAFTTDAVNFVKGPAGAVAPYDPAVPLEAMVEARPVSLQRAGRLHNVDLRLALGRRWQKLLDRAGLDFVKEFRSLYGFIGPDPAAEADFPSTAAAANWQLLAAIAERVIDGGALLAHLSVGKASDNLGLTSGTMMTVIDDLGDAFLAWANRLYFRSEPDLGAWSPRHLEYGVGLSAPAGENKAALAAPEYHGGRLDWFHFDAVAPGTGDAPAATPAPLEVTSFIPTPAQFEGMPNTRYWTFEEGVTNFGDIKPDTTDIAKLLLIEFGLVFANDWFLLPIELPVGSLTRIRGLAVTNVFGERILIDPAVTAAGPVQSWQMFRLTNKGAADDRLFLPATTPAGLESAAVEAVDFVRDEVSNMVWGLERIVQTADGASRPGREIALELHGKFQAAIVPAGTAAPTNSATIKYVLMTSVAEHWIPFIPVHVPGDNREIQLQRAAMPRLLDGAEGSVPAKIRPRTALLREGLEGSGDSSRYFIAEEEVERAGTVVETRWQRCRWTDGQVVTWLGHRRMTGRGEAWSGLTFDLALPKRKA